MGVVEYRCGGCGYTLFKLEFKICKRVYPSGAYQYTVCRYRNNIFKTPLMGLPTPSEVATALGIKECPKCGKPLKIDKKNNYVINIEKRK